MAVQTLGSVLEQGCDQGALRREVPIEGLVRQPGGVHDVGHARTRCRVALPHGVEGGIEQAAYLIGVVSASRCEGTLSYPARDIIRSAGRPHGRDVRPSFLRLVAESHENLPDPECYSSH
ncbi:hypothetical protein ACQPZ8_18425 [Actinomadura nitritigenes]|uniref:hypothetical protein n=1 Tax=Actinomadura nitritigenes TaxID=134602 RepID=UPI003D90E329